MSDEARPAPRDDAREDERLDRELLELLNEVRVAMPGVQVMFGFLLAVPFQQRFAETTTLQRTVYFVSVLFHAPTVIVAGTAAALLFGVLWFGTGLARRLRGGRRAW